MYYSKCIAFIMVMFMLGWASAATNRFAYVNNNNNNNSSSDTNNNGSTIELSISARHEQWISQYGRVYKDAEEKKMRFKIFKQNVEYIESVNRAGDRKYKLGINKFTDLSSEEFLASHTGSRRHTYYRYDPYYPPRRSSSFGYANMMDMPDSMDWRAKECCWAFAAVAAIEGINQIKTGKLVSLSEQELVDCDIYGSNHGCDGGFHDNAFEFVMDNRGLTTEGNYPYQGKKSNCKAAATSAPIVTISGYVDVPQKNEYALLQAVANQPVSVSINGIGDAEHIYGRSDFQHYQSGVFTGPCGIRLNHAMTIVGYGTDTDGTKYWLVKNQWGIEWGESGYIRMQRDVEASGGLCGLARTPAYPIA